MTLVLDDGSKLPFDSVTLDGTILTLKRKGFKGTAVAVEIGGEEFAFRHPVSFLIPEAIKQSSGLARLVSEGDDDDTLSISFTL
jgi:hypothetical protein